MATKIAAPKKTSRLLAALDNPESLFDDDPDIIQLTGQKRGLDASEHDGRGSNKRRVKGLGIRQASPAVAGSSSENTIWNSLNSQSPSPDRPPRAAGPSVTGSFALRYDQESMIRKIDIGGQDQALRMAEFVTKTIDNASHGLTVQAAMENLGLQDNKDLLPGLEVRLLPHQMIGVSWMLQQERNTPHKGGILADDMGLGKTVQMIACMAMNMPSPDERHRGTLIVVPAALLTQWKDEIESKTNGLFTVHLQHGKEKFKSLARLQEKDVVITTYQTLNMDFAVPADVESDEEMEWLIENGGLLARMKWYRVITDESQFIRNRGTRSSKAVAMLRAKYRWCLTGTPVTNTLADIYGLLRFGHFRPWNHWDDFNNYIAKTQLEDAPLAGLRAQEVLKPLLLRRTKDAKLEGRPLLELPEKDIELVKLQFSQDERELYNHLEKKAQIALNKYIKQNTIVKNHSAVLVMILRLRQLCGHPNLILSREEAAADPALAMGDAGDKELARANKIMGSKWVADMKRKFLDRAIAAQQDYDDDELEAPEGECPICGEMFVNNGCLLACGHEVCQECIRELATSPIVHDGIFGQADEQTNLRIEKEFETAAAKGLRPCPTCKKMNDLKQTAVFLSSAFQPTSEDLKRATQRKYPAPKNRNFTGSNPGSSRDLPTREEIQAAMMEVSDSDDSLPDISTIIKNHKPSSNGKSKGKTRTIEVDSASDDDLVDITVGDITSGLRKSNIRKTSGQGKYNQRDGAPASTVTPSQHLLATWREGGENLEASVKMTALVRFLQEWESTGDKTIVFSQWTSMLDLVETLFSRHGIQNLRFDGSMNREAREAVLSQFRKSGGPRVILISTKCGGVGLNLTSANRIVNLDLSWNYASESQAYDRVHRLGQEKEVFVKRLVIEDTIEERMLKLQDTKTGLAEAALGEGTGVKLHKLSVKELKALFGMSKNNNSNNDGNTADDSY